MIPNAIMREHVVKAIVNIRSGGVPKKRDLPCVGSHQPPATRRSRNSGIEGGMTFN